MDDKSIFYGGTPGVFHSVWLLSNLETEAEKKWWEYLKKNQREGPRFNGHHPVWF